MYLTPTVSTGFVDETLASLKSLGYLVDSPTLHELVQYQAENRTPLHLLTTYLLDVEKQFASSNKHLGLDIGQAIKPAGFQLLGHLIMACKNIEEAVPFVTQYQQLVIDGVNCQWQSVDKCWIFSWKFSEEMEEQPQILHDILMASAASFGIWVTGGKPFFEKVYFQYDVPESIQHHRHIFSCDAEFNAKHNALTVSHDWNALDIVSACADLKSILSQQADEEVSRLNARHSWQSRLEHTLERLLDDRHLNLDTVARHMGSSKRTLQRQLQQNSMNFNGILKKIRRKKANDYLAHTQLSLYEIALKLGYQDQSAFSTAYKSWEGCSPSSRRNLQRKTASY